MTWTEKRRVEIPEGELALVEAGDTEAPTVVLVSGGFTSSYLWRGLIPLLSPWMLPAQVANVRSLLAALGIQRFAVVGHGRGGGVAQLLAIEGGVEALVLIDSIAFDAWPSPQILELRSRVGDVRRTQPG